MMTQKQETLIVSLLSPCRFTSSDFQLTVCQHFLSKRPQANSTGGWEGKRIWTGDVGWKGDEAGPPKKEYTSY